MPSKFGTVMIGLGVIVVGFLLFGSLYSITNISDPLSKFIVASSVAWFGVGVTIKGVFFSD